jgi:hypothetical protein
VTHDHINDWNLVAILDSVEENNVPENVKKDNARSEERACDEENIAATLHSHRPWTDCISENIDNLKEARDYSKTQA